MNILSYEEEEVGDGVCNLNQFIGKPLHNKACYDSWQENKVDNLESRAYRTLESNGPGRQILTKYVKLL